MSSCKNGRKRTPREAVATSSKETGEPNTELICFISFANEHADVHRAWAFMTIMRQIQYKLECALSSKNSLHLSTIYLDSTIFSREPRMEPPPEASDDGTSFGFAFGCRGARSHEELNIRLRRAITSHLTKGASRPDK